MREHEVPTHVQAEDRMLLWLTFPQVVAMTAVCALSYGAYHYVPGPSEARMALAVLLGLFGAAMIVGKIGGRLLPLVAAGLLKYRLGARRYDGPVSQLVRSEPPASVQSTRSVPGPLSLMAHRPGKTLRKLRRRKKQKRNGERRPFRPHGWFGKRRKSRLEKKANGNRRPSAGRNEKKGHRGLRSGRFLGVLIGAVALAVLAVTVPQSVAAEGHEPEEVQTFPEIEFEVPETVPGRRIFVEGIQVSGDRAAITLRAATSLELRVRAFGGSHRLLFTGMASLDQGERIDYSLPLDGPFPSLSLIHI